MIVLVRHGETAGNAARVLQTPDTPLSEAGLDQAERLARRLAALGVERILSSDYARARMTAERVRAATGAGLELDPGLRERSFGDLRGRAYAELGFDPFAPDYVPPGGESWEDLHARVDAAWQRIAALAERGSGALVVVTHGLVCHSLVRRRLALPADLGPVTGFANTAVTLADRAAPWTVRLLACTAHLAEPAPALSPDTRSEPSARCSGTDR